MEIGGDGKWGDGGEGDYVYLTVKDAKSAVNQKVSLLAAVVHRGLLEPSRQSADYVCTLKIVDYSCHECSLPVRFFGTKSMLPLVQSDGDIICRRHVMIRFCDGKVFAIFKKEISSFALFKGDDFEDIKVYQVSKPSSSVTAQDKAFIRQLQTLLTKNLIHAGLLENVLPLSEIQKCGCCSLVCKLIKYIWDFGGWVMRPSSDSPSL